MNVMNFTLSVDGDSGDREQVRILKELYEEWGGRLAAELMDMVLKGQKGAILVAAGDEGSLSHKMNAAGFEDYFRKHNEDITVRCIQDLYQAEANKQKMLACFKEDKSIIGVFAMPYLFSGTEQKYKALDGEAGQKVLAALSDYNMVGLDYYEAGSRCFYTVNKPVRSVAGLKGMKFRVQPTEVAISMVQALGAEATPMEYGEVFQGLQNGIVDGAENDFVSYFTSGHYEVAKYYSLDGHMAPPALLICSQAAWDKMSGPQREGVIRASREAAQWQRQAMQDFQEESRAKCEEAGCEVIEVDIKEFQDAVASVYDEYPQYKEVVDMVRAAQ